MTLTSDEVIDTLSELGTMATERQSPWPQTQNEYDIYEIDWDRVLDLDPNLGNDSPFAQKRGDIEEIGRQIADIANQQPRTVPPNVVIDALAWYQPIHYFAQNWGIFITEKAVIEVAGRIASFSRRSPPESPLRLNEQVILRLIGLSLSILYFHEAFHHKVESLAIRLEVVRQEPVYIPYHDGVYVPHQNTDDQLEESLACTEMYRRLSEKRYRKGISVSSLELARDFVSSWIVTLPPGYRKGMHFVKDADFSSQINRLANQVDAATTKPTRSQSHWSTASHMFRGLFDVERVSHVIVPIGDRAILPWLSDGIYKLSVKRRDLEKFLRKSGCQQLAGGKGSHAKYQTRDRKMVIVPAHDDLSALVLRSTAHTLGYPSTRKLLEAIRHSGV